MLVAWRAGMAQAIKDTQQNRIRTAASLTFACAVKRRWFTAGESPARELFAPPGSNRSSSGGNEAAEASGVEGRF